MQKFHGMGIIHFSLAFNFFHGQSLEIMFNIIFFYRFPVSFVVKVTNLVIFIIFPVVINDTLQLMVRGK